MIYTHVAALLIGAAVAGTGAWKVQDWRFGAKEADRMEQAAKEEGIRLQRIDTAAVGHEADKAEIRTEFITITETVERIVREPFYAAGAPACLDPDGLRQLTDAIRGPNAASQPPAAVPRPRAAD